MNEAEAKIFFDKLGCGLAMVVQKINDTRNFNFIVASDNGKKYLLKTYNKEKRGGRDTELLAFSRLAGSPYVKPLVQSGDNFILSEFIEGKLLKNFISEGDQDRIQVNYLTLQVVSFVKTCNGYEGNKFGRIQADGSSEFESWGECLHSYLSSLIRRANTGASEDKEYILKRLEKLRHFFEKNRDALNKAQSRFVPVDLNLTNFIVAREHRVIATDLESFWHADPLLAYGDWMGNTYGTALCDTFVSHWGLLNPVDASLVRAYALLSNLSALLYISENSESALRSATPWGNSNTYLSLIALHEEFIFGSDLSLDSQHVSIRNSRESAYGGLRLLSRSHLDDRIAEVITAIRRFSAIEFGGGGQGDFYVLVYGSYAYKLAQPSSDLDLVFVVSTIDKNRVERIVHFVKTLHAKYGMRRDDEIPYEFKVAFTISFVDEASSGAGIKRDGEWHVPEILKTREYLTSKPLLLRFMQGMLANPHIFADGNYELYAQHRFDATRNLIKAVLSLNGLSKVSAADLLRLFCSSPGGASGDFYFGFSLKGVFKAYLLEYLETVLRRMLPPSDYNGQGSVYEFTSEQLSASPNEMPAQVALTRRFSF